MESGQSLEEKIAAQEVVVMIPGTKGNSVANDSSCESASHFSSDHKLSIETSFRRGSLSISVYPEPNSRIVESLESSTIELVEDNVKAVPPLPSSRSSSSETRMKSPIPDTPRTPRGGEDEDDGKVCKTGHLIIDEKKQKKKSNKIEVMIVIEGIAFFCILGVLIASLTIDKFTRAHIWDSRIWKWCVLAVVICGGRLVTGWFTNFLTFLIERNFLLENIVLYFLYALKESVRVFIWLGLILLAWSLLINRAVDSSSDTKNTLNKITRGIACTLAGAGLWIVKTFLIKLLAASFHARTFFDKIQKSIFDQHVLQTLSEPGTFEKPNKGKQKAEDLINVNELQKETREEVSAWTMSALIKVISSLSTVSGALDDQKEIENELEAKAEAKRIFKNVAKPGKKHIEEEDLKPFFEDQVDDVFRLFEGTEEKQVNESSFENWVVNVYNERKCLVLSLNDSKTAIEELNRIASVLIFVVIIIAWLLLMGITTTEVLIFISSQLLLLAFMFGDSMKTVFEGIMFTFVVHPFDVGDLCFIDGKKLVVDEMNFLTTTFLGHDKKKIYYPNSVLAGMPILNFNRSSQITDSVKFPADSVESIELWKC